MSPSDRTPRTPAASIDYTGRFASLECRRRSAACHAGQASARIFETREIDTKEPEICISGLVLRGVKKPHDCPAFGSLCTPERPLGATMVSAEGACAAYYTYGRHLQKTPNDEPALAPAP